jgi:hypothetical protein
VAVGVDYDHRVGCAGRVRPAMGSFDKLRTNGDRETFRSW